MRTFTCGLALVVAFTMPLCAADAMGGVDLLDRFVTPDGRVVAKAVVAKGAGPGNFLVEPVLGDDGRPTGENVWAEDILVDVLPPDAFDRELRMQIYRGEDKAIAVALYGDKSLDRMRANGYILGAPRDANIVKVVREDENSRIVWQDRSGSYFSSLVPRLPNRSGIPSDAEKHVKTEAVTDDMVRDLDLPPPTARPGSAATTTGGGSSSLGDVPIGNLVSSGQPLGGGAAASGVIDVPPIEEPGNPYGIDPILSPDEVRAAAAEAFANVRSQSTGDLAMNDFGVGTGGRLQIQHVGGIDDCLDATHAQLKFFPAVMSHVQQIAREKRTRAEKDRAEAIRRAQEAAAGAQQGTSATPTGTAGPVATSTDRPGGNVTTPAAPTSSTPQTPTIPTAPAPPTAPPDDSDFEPGDLE